MSELDAQLRRDLARLRVRQGPPAGAEAAVLAAVRGAIGGGPGGGGAAGGSTAGSAAPWTIAKSIGAIVGIAGGTVASIAVVASLVREPTPERPPVTDVQTVAPDSEPDSVVPMLAPEPEAPAMDEPTVAPAAKPEVDPVPRPERRDRTAVRARPAEPTLAEELEGLRSARAESSPAARLRMLQAHRRRFGDGVVGIERDALEIETLCELGKSDRARVAADRFFAAHPSSPLRTRLRAACPSLKL